MKRFDQLTEQEKEFALELTTKEIIDEAVRDNPLFALLATALIKDKIAQKSLQLAMSRTYLEKSNGDILW
jgi:hypothetical protein